MPQAPPRRPSASVLRARHHELVRTRAASEHPTGWSCQHLTRRPNIPSATAAEPPAAPRRSSAAPRLPARLRSPPCCCSPANTRIGCDSAHRAAHRANVNRHSSSQRLSTSLAASRTRTNTSRFGTPDGVEPPTTSPVAPTFPQRRPQNQPPHRAAAPPPPDSLSPVAALSCPHPHRVQPRTPRRKSHQRQSPHSTVGTPRWPAASVWAAPRPQRSEDAGRTPPPHAAGHQLQKSKCRVVSLSRGCTPRSRGLCSPLRANLPARSGRSTRRARRRPGARG